MDAKPTSLARRLLAITLAMDLFWVVSYLALFAMGPTGARLLKVFDLDAEANPPAWWSGSQLLVIGLVALVLALRPFSDDERITPLRPALWAFGLGFVFLSADEIGGIHEDLAGLLRGQSIVRGIGGEGVWMLVYTVIGVALIVLFARYAIRAWKLWPRESAIAAGGFALLIFGGALVETIGYVIGLKSAGIQYEIVVEEACEMIGASVLLYACMRMLTTVGAALLAKPGDVATDVVDEAA